MYIRYLAIILLFWKGIEFLCMRILFCGWSDWTSHDQSTPSTIRIFSRVFGIQFGDSSLNGSRPIARTKPATDKHAHRQTEGYTIPEVFVDSSFVTNSRKTYGHISFYTTSHWGQPHEDTVVKMAPTRPLASKSFCLLVLLCDHRSLSNLQQRNTEAWYTLHQNDRLVSVLVFVQWSPKNSPRDDGRQICPK